MQDLIYGIWKNDKAKRKAIWEDVMKETLEKLETNISEALKLMEISLQDTIKTIQNSRKELK